MKKLFVDLDDTFVDTERYLRKICESNGLKVPKYETIYTLYGVDGYKPYFDMVFNNYFVIPKKQGVIENINLLETEYDIVFCTFCTTKEEKVAKKKFAESMGKDIILCEGDDFDKSSIDMSGGILIDDSIDVLKASNADKKLQMYNEFTYTQILKDCSLVVDWFDIVDQLMEVSVDEKLRDFISNGISRCYSSTIEKHI